MFYGHNKTIHGTQKLNIEIDNNGSVVSVWFRCCALPFDVTVVNDSRAEDMCKMSDTINKTIKLNAVDIDTGITPKAIDDNGPAIEGRMIPVVTSMTPRNVIAEIREEEDESNIPNRLL